MNISQLNGPYLGSAGADGVGSALAGGTSSTMFPSYSNSAYNTGDGFTSQYPAYGSGLSSQSGLGGGGILSSLMGMMSSLIGMMQSLAGSITGGSQSSLGGTYAGYSNGSQTTDPQTAFSNATVSSTGDPHLALNGTEANGASTSNKFDSMVSHQDLIDSNSIAGGFRVSTNVTSPNSNGVTLNQSATVHSNYGQNSVTMDNSGNVTATRDGQPVTLTVGQPTHLGNGETVTKNGDGSVTVVNKNQQGDSITTNMSLTSSGGTNGVNVTTTANNVNLGGDIVNGNATPSGHTDQPWAAQSGSGFGTQGFASSNPSSGVQGGFPTYESEERSLEAQLQGLA